MEMNKVLVDRTMWSTTIDLLDAAARLREAGLPGPMAEEFVATLPQVCHSMTDFNAAMTLEIFRLEKGIKGIVKQQDTWSCYAACAAMATGAQVADVVAYVGHDGSAVVDAVREKGQHPDGRVGFSHAEIAGYLLSQGLLIGFHIAGVPEGAAMHIDAGDKMISVSVPMSTPALLTVRSEHLPAPAKHCVYWTGSVALDPGKDSPDVRELSDLQVLEWRPLTRIEE